MPYQPKDRFYHRAQSEDFVARSVYKLQEIDRRFRLLGKGQRLVDFGCAPGSWLQLLSESVGKKGAVIGYDLEPVARAFPKNVRTFIESIDDLDAQRIRMDVATLVAELKKKPQPESVPPSFRIDGVLSDMAPKLTGIRDADQAKSVALVRIAYLLSEELVAPAGFFVAKLFQGRDTDELVEQVKGGFREVKLLKPEATRDGSREIFIFARNRRT